MSGNMMTTTSPGLSQRTTVWAAREMLKHAGPVRILEKTGPLVKPFPKNKGLDVKFRRPIPFAPATTPLMEGVTPTPTMLRFEDVPGRLEQYGEVAIVTDVIEDTHEDPVLQALVVQLGENIARTMEALDWAVLTGGTNVFYANGTARNQVNTTITLQKQRAVTRYLKAQKAMKVTQPLNSGPDYATFPIESAYIAVAHSNLDADIRGMANFKSTSEYAGKRVISDYEIGAVEDVRYLLSPDLDPWIDAGGPAGGMVSTGGTNADVYPVLYFGKEAWGTVPLRGAGAIEPSIIPANQKTKDDPLGQRGYAGWKGWHCALILNQSWMARLEVAISDLL